MISATTNSYQRKQSMNIRNGNWLTRALFLLAMFGGIGMTNAKTIYDFSAERIDGSTESLRNYTGKVLLVVNTASKCGFTKQYDGLQKIWEQYQDQGLGVLGFPANNFMRQEPGENDEIESFCKLNFGVDFPLFAKISVRGKDINPLFAWLTSKQENPEFAGKVSWNFNKFLISRDGRLINRFDSRVEPRSDQLVKAIEAALKN